MLPALRTRSCTTEPCSISNQRDRLRLADDDLRHVVVAGEAEDFLCDVRSRDGHGLAAEPLGKTLAIGDAIALDFAQSLRAAVST